MAGIEQTWHVVDDVERLKVTIAVLYGVKVPAWFVDVVDGHVIVQLWDERTATLGGERIAVAKAELASFADEAAAKRRILRVMMLNAVIRAAVRTRVEHDGAIVRVARDVLVKSESKSDAEPE